MHAGTGASTTPSAHLRVGGQQVIIQDLGHSSGLFHVYERFQPDAADPPRTVLVFLPRRSGRRYPVVYLNDGNTAFFRGGPARKTMDVAGRLAQQAGTATEAIAVGVHPVDRNREYTHAPWGGLDCCGVERYSRYLAEVVKPFVDANYPTLPGAADTLVLGASHGGLAAFYTAVRRPEAFGSAAALSPSFWAGLDDASNFPRVREVPGARLRGSALLQALGPGLADGPARPRIYLEWGLVRRGGAHNEHLEERATQRGREMAEILQSDFGYRLGDDLVVCEDPHGEHDEDSWGRHLPAILGWFAGRRAAVPPAAAGEPR